MYKMDGFWYLWSTHVTDGILACVSGCCIYMYVRLCVCCCRSHTTDDYGPVCTPIYHSLASGRHASWIFMWENWHTSPQRERKRETGAGWGTRQCRVNAGPTSQTVAQHWADIDACWEAAALQEWNLSWRPIGTGDRLGTMAAVRRGGGRGQRGSVHGEEEEGGRERSCADARYGITGGGRGVSCVRRVPRASAGLLCLPAALGRGTPLTRRRRRRANDVPLPSGAHCSLRSKEFTPKTMDATRGSTNDVLARLQTNYSSRTPLSFEVYTHNEWQGLPSVPDLGKLR